MGKRLRKRELLREIEFERGRLDELLARITPRQMTQSGVTLAGWSVKDILGHLIGWQQMNLEWYTAGERGETPEVPAQGLTWQDIRELNGRIYRKQHRRSLKAIVVDYVGYHQAMLRLIDEVADKDLVTVGRFSWTGPTWTLSDYLRRNTASHYRWACKHLRKWLKSPQG